MKSNVLEWTFEELLAKIPKKNPPPPGYKHYVTITNPNGKIGLTIEIGYSLKFKPDTITALAWNKKHFFGTEQIWVHRGEKLVYNMETGELSKEQQ